MRWSKVFLNFERSLHRKTVPRLYLNNVNLTKSEIQNLPTHELIIKLGFLMHPKSGLVHWLPMGWMMVENAKEVIRRNMKNAGAEEVSLSLLSSADVWKKTGRWNNSELFKLKDSNNTDICLAATCEEEITNIIKGSLSSYKSLPLIYFQIKEKYRDEKRPRGGLLRGREFIMKDAYSFDIDEDSAMKTYNKMVVAYAKIFEEFKVPIVKADADSGDIGGSVSHEWHYISSVGEDTLFTCNKCKNVSNIEKTKSYPEEIDQEAPISVSYFITKDKSLLICAYYPSSRPLQESFLKDEFPDIDFSVKDESYILDEFSNMETLINKRVVRVMDSRLNHRSPLPDFPIPFVNRSLITTLTDIPLVSAVEGEICGVCEDGNLQESRAIEVGHTFYLGDKYSEPMNLSINVPDKNGKLESRNVLMGCYGIGISRIIAAIAEITRDDQGLCFPVSIAPWHLTVVESSSFDPNNDEVYEILERSNISYRLDDRAKTSMGKKIKDSTMIGIPLVLILGKEFPHVQIEIRGKRHSGSLKWRDLYKNNEFKWEVEYDSKNIDVKHICHIDNLEVVLKSLLEDM